MNFKVISFFVIVFIVGTTFGLVISQADIQVPDIGSVSQGNGYIATSTPSDRSQISGQIIKGKGTLGSAVVTSPGTTRFCIYDATTTDATLRPTAIKATSTIELGCVNTANVGTYTFDVDYSYGLYLDVKSGTEGTTTVTYR